MYFAPPPSIDAIIFTRLPDRFRKPRPTSWAAANRGGQEIDSFLEGPSFDRQGRLYVTDIPFGRVFRISPEGEWTLITEYDGWPNGLKIHRDGRIFITDYKRGIMLLDPETGAVTPLLETAASESFKGVNDLVFAPNGDLYFTDQGQTGLHDPTGRVYKLSADGQLSKLIDTAPSPNGIVFDPQMSHLLVAVTRAQQVWRMPLHNAGLTTKVGVFAQLHGGLGGPDGMALDCEGGLLVAHVGFGSIWHLTRLGEPRMRIRSPAGITTTNLAFGGPENRDIFITESQTGSILRARVDVAGAPMFSHQE